MRILMTASSYPRFAADSAAIFLRELARHLARGGSDVHVLAPADPAAKAGEPADPGVTVHRFAYGAWGAHRLAYGSGILPNLSARPALAVQVPGFVAGQAVAMLRLVHRLRPQVLHAHWVLPQGLLAALLTRRVPVVVSAHGGDAWALRGGGVSALKRWTLRRAQAWTANTVATATACAGSGVPAPQVIPMGVDCARFAAGDGAGLKARLGESRPVVLFVGRLVEKKGVPVLLDAWTRLRQHGAIPPAVLWLVGDGDLRPQLQRQAQALGDAVRFFGRVPNDQLPDFYAAAEICVTPSVVDARGDTEGQGVVLLEAMAAGRAVVASHVGGIAEVVEHDATGVLVPSGDAPALAQAIAALLTDPTRAQALGAAGQRAARQQYDWPIIAQRFQTLYDALTRAGGDFR